MSNFALFAGLSWEGKLVSALLIVLTVLAVALCRKSRARLSAEEESELTRLHNAIRTKPPDSIDAAEQLLPASSPSLVVRALREGLYQGKIDRELLTFDAWIYWSRYLAGVFVFIGLCGTVWGIATSVSSLGQAVTSISHATAATPEAGGSAFTLESWSRLLNGIEQLLAGMKSAFVCTLLGLVATLVVSWVNARYIGACRQVEDQVQALADRVFLPMHQQVNSHQNREAMQERMRQALTVLSDSATQLSQSLEPATENLHEIAAITKNITRNLQIAADTLKQQNITAEERSSQIQRILTDLSQRLLLSYQHLENSANALKTAAGGLSREQEGLTSLTNEVKSSARQMEVTVRRLVEELSDAQAAHEGALQGVSDSISATHKTLQRALREFERTLNEVIVTAESPVLRQELEQMRTELLREVRHVDSHLRTLPVSSRPADNSIRNERPEMESPLPDNRQTPLPSAATHAAAEAFVNDSDTVVTDSRERAEGTADTDSDEPGSEAGQPGRVKRFMQRFKKVSE